MRSPAASERWRTTPPPSSPEALYPFQVAGVRALVERPAVLLADDMGLGKTAQAARALAELARRGELERALVVAPRGLLGQWRRELERWAPELTALRVEGPPGERAWRWAAEAQVHLASYESARSDAAARARPWDVVVLDEAQRIKNRDVQTARALKRIPRHRSWALTGTPLENRAEDLASILEFVAPNPDGGPPPSLWVGPRLAQLHAGVQLRRRKADVLADLPAKTLVRVELELAGAQRRAYLAVEAAARGRLRALGEAATVMNVLEAIQLLKQACNHCPDTGASVKGDDLAERVGQIAAAGHKTLVFSQWRNARFGAERIAAGLAAWRPLLYTGALTLPEREAVVHEFTKDPERRVLALSLRAGGQGLNLQAASYVVHFDRWWNPAVEDQATDRAHRAGQLNPVTVYAYVCADTIEERIEAILAEKRALFRAMVDGVSLDPARAFSAEDLFGLLGLPAPARLRRGEAPATPPP